MQDTRSEHNVERRALGLAALGASLAVLAIASPRLFGGPLLDDWLGGTLPEPWLRWAVAGIGVVAGILAALAASLTKPVRDRAQTLGICCGGTLAAAVHTVLVAHAPGLFEAVLSALLVIPVGVAAAALLTDRGLLPLTLAGLVVGAPIAFGRASAIGDRSAATTLARVRDEALRLGVERAFVSLDAGFGRRARLALQASLLPPHVGAPVHVHAVEAGSEEERLLRQAGFGGVTCVAGTVTRLEPDALPGSARTELVVHAEMQGGGMPRLLVERPSGTFVLRVLTPLGAHRQSERDPTAGLMLLDDALKRYLGEVAGLPVGAEVLVRVEDEHGAASPWIPLAMPPR